jgi:hypothetical protein
MQVGSLASLLWPFVLLPLSIFTFVEFEKIKELDLCATRFVIIYLLSVPTSTICH